MIDFLAHFQDASLPSVNIVNMDVTQNNDQALLTMNLLIYTSPFCVRSRPRPDADALADHAHRRADRQPHPADRNPGRGCGCHHADATPLPSATPTFTVTPLPPPSATLQPTPTRPPSATPAASAIPCDGAPPTLFQPGDIAVVDFNGLGALRVFADPNGSIVSTRTQAYDNQSLEIVTGPVCANHMYYWYIRNLSGNNAVGWVAEAQGDQRYLCPEDDPECVPVSTPPHCF